ncbi:MAG: phosphatidylglycerophosphatase A [Planctomycetes bacterium]|nr:phosphatidylglycerophosphatase A [Planctomycetota bacterium]
MMKTIAHLTATFFGLGHAPVASGTVGSAGALALVLALGWALPADRHGLYLPVVLVLAALLFAVGVPAGSWAERRYGRKDPSQCVVDEVVGYLIAVAWISPPGWAAALVAFLVFRGADIVKPYPARRLEALPGGLGILLDDVVAGLYSLVVMIGVRLFLTG